MAYVGSDVRASAICMDKIVTKIMLEKAGLKTAPYRNFLVSEKPPVFSQLCRELDSENLIVKAAALGSSIGVYLCKDEVSFKQACEQIQSVNSRILVEKQIQGREFEVAILGNQKLEVPVIGEVILNNHDFYSYEAKYLDEKGVELIAPADISEEWVVKIQETSKKAYNALYCSGMARVDSFLVGEEIYLNEINSLPGFTKVSTYPRLWQESGLEYSALIDKLLQLALERKAREQQSEVDFAKLVESMH